nr:DNA cytosine methyltransferase [Paraburkholderia sacchari]
MARALTTSNQRIDVESETLLVAHALRGEGFDASEDGTGRGTPLIAVHPYTLAIRGRGEGRELEYRQDGAANAIVTACGGRDGMNVGAVAYAIQAGAARENPESGPDGIGVQSDVAYTIEARVEVQAVAFDLQQITSATNRSTISSGASPTMAKASLLHAITQPVVDTLTSNRHESNGAKTGSNPGVINPVLYASAVRRLTPCECERLQGFPDFYTAIPFRGKRAADGPRYRALGNSMAIPPMRWIGERIQVVDSL